MTAEEKFYRRAFNLLEELLVVYKSGVDTKGTELFWENQKVDSSIAEKRLFEQKNALLLIILVAILGINKESIDKAGIVDSYNESVVADLSKVLMSSADRKAVNYFKSMNRQPSMFGSWLSIIKNFDENNNDKTIFRQVRNSLLHSNFTLDDNGSNLVALTHLKIKSNYEAIILNFNFYQFILSYFSNVPSMGLSEKTYIYMVETISNIEEFVPMDNQDKLINFMRRFLVWDVNSKVNNYDGNNFFGTSLINNCLENSNIYSYLQEVFTKKMDDDVKLEDVNFFKLSNEIIHIIVLDIERRYGFDFYNLDFFQQSKIIRYYLEIVYENKRQISSNLVHLFKLVLKIGDKNFIPNVEDFVYDKSYNLGMMASLSILKAYLVIYRVQNKTFSNIDYEKINLEFDDNIYFNTLIDDEDMTLIDLRESIKKVINKKGLDYDSAIKFVVLDSIRNALAHGNVNVNFSVKSGEIIIELADIYKNRKRTLKMTLDKFDMFFNSEAFLPRYCYTNNQDLSRSLKKEKP
ncbi:MAG: hypothetical protein IJO33_00415 [Bacilli bacterium]|nr:hypothetical protein [Bacilli bacterium]